MSSTDTLTGTLSAGKWKKVMWGWGYYTLTYSISVGAGNGQFECYTAPLPFPFSSGKLPKLDVTHKVIGYGDVWIRSSVNTTYAISPA